MNKRIRVTISLMLCAFLATGCAKAGAGAAEDFQTKEDALKYIAEHFHLHSEKEIEDFNNNSAGNYIYINEYKLTES